MPNDYAREKKCLLVHHWSHLIFVLKRASNDSIFTHVYRPWENHWSSTNQLGSRLTWNNPIPAGFECPEERAYIWLLIVNVNNLAMDSYSTCICVEADGSMESLAMFEYLECEYNVVALAFLLYPQQCSLQVQPETDLLQGCPRWRISVQLCHLKTQCSWSTSGLT